MNFLTHAFRCCALLVAAGALTGCGGHIGSKAAPQIHVRGSNLEGKPWKFAFEVQGDQSSNIRAALRWILRDNNIVQEVTSGEDVRIRLNGTRRVAIGACNWQLEYSIFQGDKQVKRDLREWDRTGIAWNVEAECERMIADSVVWAIESVANDGLRARFRNDLVEPGDDWWCFSYEFGAVIERDARGRETLDASSHFYGGRCARKKGTCEDQRTMTAQSWKTKGASGRNSMRHIDDQCSSQARALCYSSHSIPLDKSFATCTPTMRACREGIEAEEQAGDSQGISDCTAVGSTAAQ